MKIYNKFNLLKNFIKFLNKMNLLKKFYKISLNLLFLFYLLLIFTNFNK